ncbi:hypothetical protein [Sphingomonas sp. KR3-1]|uniref:hypothetical protein n=1 Tax=Sphingomonas sp. KR3-1 TaxID=3156611 RepID=UPI0032B5032F
MEHQPIQYEAADSLADYTPVALRHRHDGWTADRQRLFLTALSETGSISDACKVAEVSPRSAYRLRARADAYSFADAWDEALLVSVTRLASLAFERATRGTIRELWKDGVLVAESRQPSDKLLMFLLQHLRAEWFKPKTKDSRSPASGAERRYANALAKLADNEEPVDPLRMRHYEATPPEDPIDPLDDMDEV